MRCISISNSLLKCQKNPVFFKRIITSDENWIVYNNEEQKRSWGKLDYASLTSLKANLYLKKMMLCTWWEHKGIVYYKLLPQNQTLN